MQLIWYSKSSESSNRYRQGNTYLPHDINGRNRYQVEKVKEAYINRKNIHMCEIHVFVIEGKETNT